MIIPTIDVIGGAERQVLLLSKALSTRRWRVTIVALSGNGGVTTQELADAGVAYLSLGMRKAWIDPRGWICYLQWAAANKPDVIHAHLPHATWFARWIRLLAPARILIDTIHTSNTGGPGRQLGYRLSNWLSNHVTCVSDSVASAATAAHMAHPETLTILPNGVVIPQPNLQPQPAEPQPFQWIAIGRLARVKDYPTLLRAFAKLQGRPHLKIAGSGPEEEILRKLAAELNIEDRVEFAGFHRDVQHLLASTDAFVLSSLWEGLPISILEAAAAGLPVVATDGNGTREAMIPDKTGLIVPVADVASLSHAMAMLMTMPPEDRLNMGARGRQLVEGHFSLPIVVGQWEKLYSQLLQEHPHTARCR
jgi:glycosyltransferase involved in cell wall biosynthesis